MEDTFRELLEKAWVPLVISLVSAFARILFDGGKCSMYKILRSVTLGVFVGMFVGMLISDLGMGSGVKGAVIGAAVIVAEDVLGVIVAAGGKLREDPIEAIKNFLPFINWKR